MDVWAVLSFKNRFCWRLNVTLLSKVDSFILVLILDCIFGLLVMVILTYVGVEVNILILSDVSDLDLV